MSRWNLTNIIFESQIAMFWHLLGKNMFWMTQNHMYVSSGHSLREIRTDLMYVTCFASTRSCGSWFQHITNSSIRSRTKQPQLTAVIRKCHLQWFGHLQQMDMDCIPNLRKPAHRKRRTGRPKTSWQKVIQKNISKMDLGCWGRGCRKGADYVEVSFRSGSKCSNARCWPVRK